MNEHDAAMCAMVGFTPWPWPYSIATPHVEPHVNLRGAPSGCHCANGAPPFSVIPPPSTSSAFVSGTTLVQQPYETQYDDTLMMNSLEKGADDFADFSELGACPIEIQRPRRFAW